VRRLSLLLGVLLLAACGAQQEASSPADVLDQAAEKLEAAGSLRYTLDVSMRSRDMSDRPIPFRGEGVTTTEDERGIVLLDLAPMFKALIAHEAGPGQREFMESFFDHPEDWRAEVRYIGDKGWMRIPALTEVVGARPWIEIADDEPESGLDIALGAAPDSPAALLPYLRALGPVDEVGGEEVRGLPTTRYQATVELERVPAQAPEGKRNALRKQIERAIEQTGQRTVPIDVWVDDDLLPRRMRFVDVSPPGRDEKYPTTYRATMEILEYGVPVRVVRPPARHVMTEGEFDHLVEGDGSA
jgi:hypothetical protein